jgi:hypothetical protein
MSSRTHWLIGTGIPVLGLVVAVLAWQLPKGSSSTAQPSVSAPEPSRSSATAPSHSASTPNPTAATTPSAAPTTVANGMELGSYTFNLPQTYSAPLGSTKPTLSQLIQWSGGDVFYDGDITTNSADELLGLPGDPAPTYQGCSSSIFENSADASRGTTFCVKENGKMAGVTVESIGTTRPYDYYLELSVTIWQDS